jgi:hypothetical protein
MPCNANGFCASCLSWVRFCMAITQFRGYEVSRWSVRRRAVEARRQERAASGLGCAQRYNKSDTTMHPIMYSIK